VLEPTFSSIQANIFTPVCEQCHSGANAPRGLRLDALNSYALLVGVASSEQPGVLRVDPHNPNGSYLIQKLEGTASVGERMPAGLPPLTQAQIAVMRQWITNGAVKDVQSSKPLRVTSLSIEPGSSQAALPASVTAVFDRDLNAATANGASFVLERSGGDGLFGNGNDVAIAGTVSVSATNQSSAVMSLTGVASVPDVYRLTLSGTGATSILDLAANGLDGEFAGTFPSGNDAAGGDFVATFEIGSVQPTLRSIQDEVFGPQCSGCHTGGAASLPGSLDLDNSNASFTNLVGIASTEAPPLKRVAPGNADDSYLLRKLEGAPGIGGERMPRGGPYLDQTTIDAIRQWINNGATQQ
jgi:mono/diheme cytochrome c family protein